MHGNHPTFTLARVAPASATLVDYTVVMASNTTGIDTAWAPEYTFSTTYHQPAFDSASLTALIANFQVDPETNHPPTGHIRQYFPSNTDAAAANAVISAAWQPCACSLNRLRQVLRRLAPAPSSPQTILGAPFMHGFIAHGWGDTVN